MGCFQCCVRCWGGVPFPSLIATLLCFSGVALFCGCGHEALTGTKTLIETHFSTDFTDYALLANVIQIFQYVIYGTASFFFLYGVLLLAEGFYTTSAVKEVYGEFRSTMCGKCVSAVFILLTYVLGVMWMGVCAASVVPVYVYYNIWATCHMMEENSDVAMDLVCVDARQYGILPWTASPGKLCGATLADVCKSSEFNLTYHLFIVTLAGAAATVIALLTYAMATTYNYAVLKFLSREDCCTKF